MTDSLSPPQIQIRPCAAERALEVWVNNRLFTVYRYPETIMKPVLYPVLTCGGRKITRGFPLEKTAGERVDHPHHVGLWLNYGDVNGLDFWNHSSAVKPEHKHRFGTIRHREVLEMQEGGPQARLVAAADWIKPDGEVLLEEVTTYNFKAGVGARVIDRCTTLRAAAEAVTFKDNKEGMIAIRVTRALEHPATKPERFTDAAGVPTEVPVLDNAGVTGCYYSSEGKEGEAVWGTRAHWVNLAGRIDDEEISVILIDHPENPGFPTYWHARGYGLFAANPLGQAAMSGGKDVLNFHLDAGESVTFQHRLVVHSGKRPENEAIRKQYATF